jgi:hypothetical protein
MRRSAAWVRVPDGGPFALWSGKILVAEMGDFKPMTEPNDLERWDRAAARK